MKKLILLLGLASCVSAQQIRGELWQNDGLPLELCMKYPDVQNYGVYRQVKCPSKLIHGCENGEPTYEEWISYCSKRIPDFLSAERQNVEDWLNKLTRPK